jgi:ubiquinone/menaquinone biosynthesis C-methylase UbiE
MNYFGSQTSAERYVKGRPHFHANTVSHIKEFLKIENKLDKALDVACGTGLSTVALSAIANRVNGTDLSAEMLKMAATGNNIIYGISAAEDQPFPDNEFNLVTVSSGVHWFDIDKFLSEAARLLTKDGFLVIYENAFPGEMENNDRFGQWTKEVYLRRFPSPPRNKNYDWGPENLRLRGLAQVAAENFKNGINFNKQELVNYLVTQSNIIAAVERGMDTYSGMETWLENELTAFLEDSRQRHVFYFNNWIKYLQKI